MTGKVRALLTGMILALSGCSVPITDAVPILQSTTPSSITSEQVVEATRSDPLIIRNDPGGNLFSYEQRRSRLLNSGRRVEIRGFCNSACTILTTLPNACLGRNARIGFHAPTFDIGGVAAFQGLA